MKIVCLFLNRISIILISSTADEVSIIGMTIQCIKLILEFCDTFIQCPLKKPRHTAAETGEFDLASKTFVAEINRVSKLLTQNIYRRLSYSIQIHRL